MIDTSEKVVERLAQDVMKPDYLSPMRHTVAATLCALAAERDVALAEAVRLHEALEIIAGRRQCIDNLMSNAAIARLVLDEGAALAQKEAPRDE